MATFCPGGSVFKFLNRLMEVIDREAMKSTSCSYRLHQPRHCNCCNHQHSRHHNDQANIMFTPAASAPSLPCVSPSALSSLQLCWFESVWIASSLALFAVRSMYLNVANYLGQRSDGTSGPVAPAEPAPRGYPPPCANRVDQPCRAREWANEDHKRRRQKRKPLGDWTRWDRREPTHTNTVINVRKNIRYELKKALDAYDAITATT